MSVRVKIDGAEHELDDGLSILDALVRLGIKVPHVCHDPRLRAAGVCRLCLVEVAGEPRPVTSCTTPLRDGMEVATHTPALDDGRRMGLQLLARDYPEELVERLPGKEFHGLLPSSGFGPLPSPQVRGEGSTPGHPGVDESHPYLRVDMGACVKCFRCVRICDEVQGQFAWRVWDKGEQTHVVPNSGTTLRASTCVACGACADTCPTGAIVDRSVWERGEPRSWTRTTCPYCGVGCELEMGVRDGRLVAARPVLDAPASRGHLCVKGRYAFDFVHAPDRVTTPLVRRGREWAAVSWEEALAVVAGRLRQVVADHGPDSVAVLGSARATNEDNYLVQKLARLVLGTNNVDCCARVCHAPSAAALGAMLGTGAATNSFADVEQARALLVWGCNPTECHPVVGARIKQAALRGAKLVVVDPRRTELASYATLHLAPRPGTDVPLLNAMARTILAEGLADLAYLEARVSGLDEFLSAVEPWTPERAALICGVAAEDIRGAARLYAGERPAMSVHGLGITEHVCGTDTVMALANLALLTGNLGKPGTGVNPLRGQNNVQGAAHMGCEPSRLTGYAPLEQHRARFEAAWGGALPATRGLDAMQMIDAALDGRLRAIWMVGYDVLLTHPDAHTTRRALDDLELLVVQDLFLTESARECAHVFLPVASSYEKDGTFMNGERRVQRVRRALPPPGEAKADWEIACALAKELGHPQGFEFPGPREIWDEVRRVWPPGAGMSYERLERGGLQWPCPDESHPGTPMLHVDGFAAFPDRRATLRRIEFVPPAEQTDAQHPFVLVTGRNLYQFNAGTMTGRTRNTELRPGDRLEMHPEDARALGIGSGDSVRVKSRQGEATLVVEVTGRVKRGELFATFSTAEVFINRVVGKGRDSKTNTPEYKVTAVGVERVATPALC